MIRINEGRLSKILVVLLALNGGLYSSLSLAADAESAAEASAAPPVPSLPLPPAVEPPKPKAQAATPSLVGDDPLAWGGESETPALPAAEAEASAPVPPAAVPDTAPGAAIAEPYPSPVAVVPGEQKTETVKASPENTNILQTKVGILEKRLDALEESVGRLQQAVVLKKNIEKDFGGRKPAAAEDVDGAESKTPPAAKKKSGKVAHKLSRSSVRAPGWILKAAKPGTAWVAEKGSSELQAVTVGDTLPGVGKITAIVKDSSGRWVVRGSKGRISQ